MCHLFAVFFIGGIARPGGAVREQFFVPPLAVLPLSAGQRQRAGRGFFVVQVVRLHTQNVGQCLVGGTLLRVGFAFLIGNDRPQPQPGLIGKLGLRQAFFSAGAAEFFAECHGIPLGYLAGEKA